MICKPSMSIAETHYKITQTCFKMMQKLLFVYIHNYPSGQLYIQETQNFIFKDVARSRCYFLVTDIPMLK